MRGGNATVPCGDQPFLGGNAAERCPGGNAYEPISPDPLVWLFVGLVPLLLLLELTGCLVRRYGSRRKPTGGKLRPRRSGRNGPSPSLGRVASSCSWWGSDRWGSGWWSNGASQAIASGPAARQASLALGIAPSGTEASAARSSRGGLRGSLRRLLELSVRKARRLRNRAACKLVESETVTEDEVSARPRTHTSLHYTPSALLSPQPSPSNYSSCPYSRHRSSGCGTCRLRCGSVSPPMRTCTGCSRGSRAPSPPRPFRPLSLQLSRPARHPPPLPPRCARPPKCLAAAPSVH